MGPKKRVITLRKVSQYSNGSTSLRSLYLLTIFVLHEGSQTLTIYSTTSELSGECDKEEPGRDQAQVC